MKRPRMKEYDDYKTFDEDQDKYIDELEKKIEELKEHLQVKKLADSPIIAMIDNKPVHQDEYEALKKQVKELEMELEKCNPIDSLFKKHDE